MPEIGEIKKGRELGYKNRKSKYIWHACEGCGKERWVQFVKGQPQRHWCSPCGFQPRGGNRSASWKGGRTKTKQGYVSVWVSPDDFFFPMANHQGYVREHRLVVAKALNRCLLSWEVVHHKGAKYPSESIENKGDNRYPENLELLACSGKHNTRILHELKRQAKEIIFLQERITLLEAENIILKMDKITIR